MSIIVNTFQYGKSVFEDTMTYMSQLKSDKSKRTVNKKDVVEFFENLYKDKQTVQVNIGGAPIKFEGLNQDQVECFLKIFEAYKSQFESTTKQGKVVRHADAVVNNNGFEEVSSVSAEGIKVKMVPTPTVD